MASLRYTARIDASPDEVWALVSDPAGIVDWFPGVDECTFDGTARTVSTMGMEIVETVITNDAELRRFQYGLTAGPMVPELHRCTIDVLEDGDGTLLVYSCDVEPDEIADLMAGVYEGATAAIAAKFAG